MMKSKYLPLLFLVLPFIILGGITLKSSLKPPVEQYYTVKITGYDPVDILRGHYLIFRYDWNLAGNVPQGNLREMGFLCFNGYFDQPLITHSLDDSGASCDARLPSSIAFGNARYYISEAYAPVLDNLIRTQPQRFDAQILVKNNRIDHLILRIDGQPLEDALRQGAI